MIGVGIVCGVAGVGGNAKSGLTPGFDGTDSGGGRWPEGAPFFDRRDPFPRTAPVGSFKPNALGLYDLFGNVAEWVDTPAPDSVGDGNIILYGLRGGSWSTGNPRQARPDYHYGIHPGRAHANSGFRILLDVAMKSETRSSSVPK